MRMGAPVRVPRRPKGSFLEEMARLADEMSRLVGFWGTRDRRNQSDSATEGDMQALQRDWEIICRDWEIISQDFRIATSEFVAEMERTKTVESGRRIE